MRGAFGRHGKALGLGFAHHLHAACRGDVLDVQRCARKAAERYIALDLQLLAFRGPTEHAQTRAAGALVDHAVADQALVLAMRHDDATELTRVVHHAAHHARVLDAAPVVGEGHGPVPGHIAHLGEGLALKPPGARAHHVDAALPYLLGHALHIFQREGVVDGGSGVGHAGDGGEAPMGGRAGAARDVLLLLLAGISQMHVDVHQPGDDHLAGKVALLGVGGLQSCAHRADRAVLHQDVDDFVETDLRVDHACVLQQLTHFHSLPTAGTTLPCACRCPRRPDPR